MSSRALPCPHCGEATIATDRPTLRPHQRRLAVMAGMAYGQHKRGTVRTQCPRCQRWVDIPGRLVIEQEA